MDTRLKPCPFCGGEADAWEEEKGGGGMKKGNPLVTLAVAAWCLFLVLLPIAGIVSVVRWVVG